MNLTALCQQSRVPSIRLRTFEVALGVALSMPVGLAGQQATVTRKLEFENEHVRVERVTIPVGYAGPMHSHTLPSLEIFLTDDHIGETLADGTKREWKSKAGEVAWAGAVTHRVENLRDAPTDILSIEFKALPPDAAKTQFTQSAPEFENDWIKVTHGKLGAKQKGAVHTHPQYVGVFLTDAKLRAHLTDGSVRELAGKRGDASWRAPVTHSIENLADAPFEAVDVNFKPENAKPKKP